MNAEQLSSSLAKYLGHSLHYTEEEIAIIAYGLFGLFQTALSILTVIILGSLFGITIEALIISFSIALLRKFSGGVHATSPERCLILGTFFSISGVFLARCLVTTLTTHILYCIYSLLFTWSFCVLYKNAPVDNVNKPIKSIHKKQKLRQDSILVVSIYLVIVILLLFVNTYIHSSTIVIYSSCLILGTIWQVFSITTIGHKVIAFLDLVLMHTSNIFKKEG